jgi:hypothetical protein
VVRWDVAAGTLVFGNPAEEHGTAVGHTAHHQAPGGSRPRSAEAALAMAEHRVQALAKLKEGAGYVG